MILEESMKRTVSVFLLVSLLLAALCLTACGGGEENLDGSYKLVSVEANGEDITDALNDVEVTMTLEGATATISMDDRTIIWQVDSENKVMINEEGQKESYRVEGNKLIVEGDGSASDSGKMVFEKQ